MVLRLTRELGLRRRRRAGSTAELGPDEYRPGGLSEALGVKRDTVKRWMRVGWVNVRRDEEAKQSLLGRLDQAQKDMQEVEETLRQGQAGDDLEQKQVQILSRLLDAQRSIHRRDFDPQREARRGEDVSRPSPAALSRDLFRENDRLRQDLLKADADRVPSHYRSLIEAYLRALNGAGR